MKLKPLKDLLLVKHVQEENKGGLVLKEAWEKPKNIVEIIDVGPLVNDVAIGQKVMINPYAVTDTQVKDEKLIREEDVLATCSDI